MTTTLYLLDTDTGQRTLSRVLLLAEGRGASPIGFTTVGTDAALLWLAHDPARRAHVVAALSRPMGVRAVTTVPLSAHTPVRRHLVHVSDGVDVVVEMDVAGQSLLGAGDGPTLAEATCQALEACLGVDLSGATVTGTAHPLTGRPTAVARHNGRCAAAAAPTPEAACLSALLVLCGTAANRQAEPVLAPVKARVLPV